MDDKHRSILQSSYVFLKKNIHNVEEVCDHLAAEEILTAGMVDSIKVKTPKPTAQMGELLNILPRRGRKAYECFKEALRQTENTDAADHLSRKEGGNPAQKDVPKTEEKGKDISEKTEEATVQYSGNKDKEHKLKSGAGQDTVNKEWPDLKNGIVLVQKKEIVEITTDEAQQIYNKGKVYPLGQKKGLVVRFSNLVESNGDGTTEGNRKQVDFDLSSTDQLFKHIGFKHETKVKFMQGDIETTLSKAEDYGCLVVLFFCGGIGFESGEIYDNNGHKINRDEVIATIRGLKSFIGKPKVVIIRSYDLEDKDKATEDELDAVVDPGLKYIKKEPNSDDLFVISSQPRLRKGPWIRGENMHGSYFIQALIHVFKNQAHEKSFLELLEEVNKCLANAVVKEGSKKAVSEILIYEHSTNIELFFFPGLKKINFSPTEEKKPVPPTEEKKPVPDDWPSSSIGNVKKNDISSSDIGFYNQITADKKVYEMTGTKKGKLIMISNVLCPKCEQKEVRRIEKCQNNVDFDNTNISNIFKYIGFESKDRKKNSTKEEILKYLKEKIDEIDKDTVTSYDCLAVVFLSGKLDGEAAQVYDKDGEEIPREEIQKILCSSLKLKGKPKLVIIQSYSFKEKFEFDNTDAKGSSTVAKRLKDPNSEDLFVVSSFLTDEDGPWMAGDDMHGSYFIQGLVHVMKTSACKYSLLDMMDQLNNLLASVSLPGKPETKKQVAEVVILEHSIDKKLYLFPKLNPEDVKKSKEYNSSCSGNPVSQPSS